MLMDFVRAESNLKAEVGAPYHEYLEEPLYGTKWIKALFDEVGNDSEMADAQDDDLEDVYI